jgi:diguanylate cyclase (GGDEF)-like protein/PAS domain S-box-containing protein
MPEVDAARMTDPVATHRETLHGSSALLDIVAAGISGLSGAAPVFEALPDILAALARALQFDRAFIIETGLPAPSGAERAPAGWQPPASHQLLFHWIAPGCAPPPRVEAWIPPQGHREPEAWLQPLLRGEVLLTQRHRAAPAVREHLDELGVRTSLLVPVSIEGRHWGHIGFENCAREHDWARDDIKLLSTLAQVIGSAITRDRFRRQALQRERLLQAVNSCAARIGTAADLRQAISDSLAILAQALEVDRMLLMEVFADSAEASLPRILLRNFWHGPDTPLRLAQITETTAATPDPDVAAWMAPLREGVAVHGQLSSATGGVRDLFRRLQAQSVLLVPIIVDTRYWGHIGLDVCGRERVWSPAEVDVLRLLADMIGTAITRERYLAELARAGTIIQKSPTILYRLRGEPSLPMVYVSSNIDRIGYSQQQLLAAPTLYRSLIHPDDRERVNAAMESVLKGSAPPANVEFRILAHDGGVRWFENCYTPVRDEANRLLEIEGTLIDISERKAAEARIANLARTDVLTALANRMTFSDHLRQAFAAAQRGARAFAVLYLDLDRFKEVNDTLGHHAGDRLLQEVARRLRDVTREIDLVARLGGDEFAIVQTGIDDSAAAGTLAEKLIEVISAPYAIDGNDLRIGVSIGISLYDGDVGSPDALLMQADQALYRAKHAGRGQYRFHSDEIDHEVRAHMALAEDLRSALARHELEMRYQPQVELASGRIVGMEGLLRWNHPTRGLVLPEDFLPIAEKYGLMQQLGRWAIDTACRQMSLWRAAGMQVPVVAINVALAQIKMGREFVRDVMDSIARWWLMPSDIELDVTELVLARSTLAQSNVLDQLRRVGVGIAIDNFGSQYSSLDYMRTYRVSRLKIARGMIAAADAEPGGVAMVRAILSLAAELGVKVVAEGVETDTQRRLLVQASSQAQGQGFYYSRAVPADETMPMLRAGVVPPGEGSGDGATPAVDGGAGDGDTAGGNAAAGAAASSVAPPSAADGAASPAKARRAAAS